MPIVSVKYWTFLFIWQNDQSVFEREGGTVINGGKESSLDELGLVASK